VLSNSVGTITSSVATLTVLLPPKITNQLVNVTAPYGGTAYFTIGASGSQPLGYQWFFNGTSLSLPNPTNVLELNNVSTNDAGAYQVTISNAVGSVTSVVATLTVDDAPTILSQPNNRSVI